MWKIQDKNGVINSGTQEEMQFIWDLTTRDLEDLYSQYRSSYTKSSIKYEQKENAITDWSGDLELVEVHNIYK